MRWRQDFADLSHYERRKQSHALQHITASWLRTIVQGPGAQLGFVQNMVAVRVDQREQFLDAILHLPDKDSSSGEQVSGANHISCAGHVTLRIRHLQQGRVRSGGTWRWCCIVSSFSAIL